MSSINSATLRVILVLLLTTGCSPKSTTSTGGSGEDGAVAIIGPDGKKSKKNLVPVKENVKEIDGNWVVVVTNKQTDFYRWIINFSRGADGKYAAEFLDSAQDKNPNDKNANDKPEIVEIKVDGDDIRFTAKTEQGQFNFVGSFQQRFIRGTIRSSPFEIFLTRLLPTDEKSLAPFDAVILPPGSDVFEAKMKSKDFQPGEFLTTINEYRTSPLAQDMYSLLIAEHARAKFDEAKVKQVIEAFLSSAKMWGERWEARMDMAVAVNLLNGRLFPRLVPPYIDSAEKKLGEDLPAFEEMLKAYREAANVGIRIQDLASASSTDEVRAAAYAGLSESLTKQPFNSEILIALANESQRTGKGDAAIEYLSDIVALPMLETHILSQRKGDPPETPTPTESLKKLWTLKHGNDEGLLAHLDEVYHARIDAFLEEIRTKAPPVKQEKSGSKTVLVEFFTGMLCPPCVAADIALSALGKSFPSSEVIVLRFHQHIPMADGLVNQDSEERGTFYEISSAPLIVVDGNLMDPRFYAGQIHMAPTGYVALRNSIALRLAEKSDVTLQLSAVVTDGQLAISVEAAGIPEELLPSCRLRMAIVENVVHTSGPSNGVRDHENVVREMPGGAKGIPPKNGKLKYSLTMPVAELQQHVVDHIARFEAGRRGEFLPEMKPPIRGPLSLVAWVQNGKADPTTHAKLVLQSALAPITGETGFGPAVEADPKPIVEAPAAANADDATESTPPPPALPE